MNARAAIVGTKYRYTGVRTEMIAMPVTAEDSAFNNVPLDTSKFRSQYVVSVGTVRGPLRLSASDRFFVSGGQTINAPSARGSFALGPIGVSGFYESKTVDSIARASVSAQLRPLSFVSIQASAGRTKDERIRDSSFTVNSLRAEGGLRLYGLWFLGGVLRRDSVRLSPPKVFDTSFVETSIASGEAAATGYTAAIRGKIWKIIGADAWAIRWNDTTGFYRPRYQTRSELYAKTNWLSRFPTGDFGFSFSAIHEYRSGMNYPVLAPGVNLADRGVGVVTAPGYRTISTLLEIRILSATISWQFRNILGERYTQVPGFAMPRQTNFYGVRWAFVD